MPLDWTTVWSFEFGRSMLRRLVPMTESEAAATSNVAQSQGFWMSGITSKQLATEALEALAAADTLQDWRENVEEQLFAAWGGPTTNWGKMRARSDLIFVNWTQSAHNESHWNELMGEVDRRPYLQFSALEDGRTSAICKACDQTLLRHDDPWWDTHKPQLHHGCRSSIISISAARAERMGITGTPTTVGADKGFGSGRAWEPTEGEVAPELNPRERPEV